jgi:alkanesulfonate monooxygenase SsuD/methylene tetrahydromethanopterin reductase-like flavin-dependent oxidoreductase (luciferase family)
MQQIGVCVASRSGLSPARVAATARASEDAGCSAFFVSERVADAVTLCQVALAATTRIRVGTAVANAWVRHPALTAMTALTMAEAYDGRFSLGLGVANRVLNEQLLGAPPAPPLSYMREYVAVLRAVFAGDAQRVQGSVFRVGPVAPDRPAGDKPVPVLLAGLLPRMLELAGEIGDGVILNLATVARMPAVLASVATGARRAGRDPADVPVACLVPCCLDNDLEASAMAARAVVLGYAGHPAARHLFGDAEIDAVAAALAAGDRDRAAALLRPDLVDAFVAHGPEQAVRDRVDAYRRAGVDLPILFPMPVGGDWDGAVTRAVHLAGQLTAGAHPTREDPQWQPSPVPAA